MLILYEILLKNLVFSEIVHKILWSNIVLQKKP
jgi:hypothetical protein